MREKEREREIETERKERMTWDMKHGGEHCNTTPLILTHEILSRRVTVWSLEFRGGKEKGFNNNGNKRMIWFCERGN